MQSVDVWVVDQRLGQGGIGTVYRCHNRHAPRIRAAVKLLSPSLAVSAEVRRRFVREAELLFQLDHPNIVKVRNIRMDHEPPFIEMAFVEGRSLARVLGEGALSIPQVCAIGAPMLRAIDYLHGRGIYHRDIKPDNLIVRGLVPTLVDFGLAAEDQRATLATPGALMGTVSYVPPEWGGQKAPEGSHWDRYSLGTILWEALRGQPAFPLDPNRAVLEQLMDMSRRKQAVPFLDPGPAVPGPLRELVKGLTALEPQARGLDLRAAADALDALGAQLAAEGQMAEPIADALPEAAGAGAGTHTTYADGFGGPGSDTYALGANPSAPTLAEPEAPAAAGAGSETLIPEDPPAEAPSSDAASPLAAPAAPSRRIAWLVVGTLAVGAALAGGTWAVLSGGTPEGFGGTFTPRLEVQPEPADPGLPVAFTLDGEAFDPETPPELTPGPHTLRARVGDGCGSGAEPLPAHCAEVVETVRVRRDASTHVSLTVALPLATPQPVSLVASDAEPERLTLDGVAWSDWPESGAWALPPGIHTVVAQRGDCPDTPCGAACEPVCSEAQVEVTVPFEPGEALSVTVALAEPDRPKAVARAASGPVSVGAFQRWVRARPAYQPGGAQAVAKAGSKYLKGWSGTEPPGQLSGYALTSSSPVTYVSPRVAEAYCEARGGLASTAAPAKQALAGNFSEIRIDDAGKWTEVSAGGRVTPLTDGAQVSGYIGFRCAQP